YIMTGITGLFLMMYMFGLSSGIAGGILLCLAFIVTYSEYAWGIKGRTREDAKMYSKRVYGKFSITDIGTVIAALAGIVIGGFLTVSSVEQLSILLNLSTTILGLSVTAVVTSLPELLTTIFSERDGAVKITIGNLIGSNIYNLALVGGIVLLFSSWKSITLYEIFMLLTGTSVFAAIVVANKGKIIPKYTGFFLLGLFITYIYFII
ncbi:MAG: hypothetical protein L0Y76_00010, partial [Ignavibacteria bacterium]|nr:hypothetical protein [Ignavibacteria bacterium]